MTLGRPGRSKHGSVAVIVSTYLCLAVTSRSSAAGGFPGTLLRVVAARTVSDCGQCVCLRGHDEVVPVKSAYLVGPPRHRNPPPLCEERRMVTLFLGESPDLVGKGQCVGEAREGEKPLELGDAI